MPPKRAAGEFVYVRARSMPSARAGGKVGGGDVDAAPGAGRAPVTDAAGADKASEVLFGVARAREAVLFLGVRPDGIVVGVDGPDKLQQSVSEWAREQCYAPVRVRSELLDDLGPRPVVAVIVAASQERPHFTGHAYVRNGPRTEKASQAVLDELIASRNSKAGAILRHKGETVTVDFQERWAATSNAPEKVVVRSEECVIDGCSAHSVDLRILASSPAFLVVDEIGYLLITRIGAMLFFQLMSRRYETATTILTSNKSFEEWGEVFGDDVMAAALIDRLVHHCHIVNIRGNSYRLHQHAELYGALRRPAEPAPKRAPGGGGRDDLTAAGTRRRSVQFQPVLTLPYAALLPGC